MGWLPFQRDLIKAVRNTQYHTVAASWPRGAGKTTIMGHLIASAMDPNSDMFRPGSEPVLVASSRAQARQAFRVAREILHPLGEHRFLDSGNRIGITHRSTNTEMRIIGSNAKQSFGLVNAHYAFVDEPGAMEIIAELEPDRRGPYAGAVGYFDLMGNMDTAITIRTLVIKDGMAYIQAGGGIVYDSVPESEYEETVHKASAALRAIEQAEGGGG